MRALPLIPFIFSAVPAHAHVGHLGELAGHSHWIALGAGVAAAAIAALAAKARNREEGQSADDAADAEETGETSAEAA